MRMDYDRILIFNTAFPGDIVLTTPLIRAVYRNFTGAEIVFCTTPAGGNILAGLSYLDRMVIYDKHGRDKGFSGMLRVAYELKKSRFDLVLSAHRSFRSAVLLALSGIPVRAGFKQSAGAIFYNRQVEHDHDVHETQRNLNLLKALNIDSAGEDYRPVLPVMGEDSNHIFGKLGVPAPSGSGPLIIVAPGSVWGTKRWLPERFAELIDKLTEQFTARVIIVGSPMDQAVANEVTELCCHKPLDLVGMTDLRGLAALIRMSNLVVAGDSSPIHVAWAYNIQTVAIYGATTPELGFAPLSENCHVVEIKNLDCRPCSQHGPQSCPLVHFKCMREISVDMVVDECSAALKASSSIKL